MTKKVRPAREPSQAAEDRPLRLTQFHGGLQPLVRAADMRGGTAEIGSQMGYQICSAVVVDPDDPRAARAIEVKPAVLKKYRARLFDLVFWGTPLKTMIDGRLFVFEPPRRYQVPELAEIATRLAARQQATAGGLAEDGRGPQASDPGAPTMAAGLERAVQRLEADFRDLLSRLGETSYRLAQLEAERTAAGHRTHPAHADAGRGPGSAPSAETAPAED